jgi:hypothetical protein
MIFAGSSWLSVRDTLGEGHWNGMNADESRSNDLCQLLMVIGPRHVGRGTLERDERRYFICLEWAGYW